MQIKYYGDSSDLYHVSNSCPNLDGSIYPVLIQDIYKNSLKLCPVCSKFLVKRCSTCKEYKSVESFCFRKSSSDGLEYQCSTCKSKRMKKRYDSLTKDQKQAAWKKKMSNPEFVKRKRCRNKTNNLIKFGKISIKNSCDICGSTENIEVHHLSYDDPYAITWLCRECHGKMHRKERTKEEIESYFLKPKNKRKKGYFSFLGKDLKDIIQRTEVNSSRYIDIITYLIDTLHWSIKKVVRETKLSRKTVRKYYRKEIRFSRLNVIEILEEIVTKYNIPI